MDWIVALFKQDSVAHAVVIVSIVIASGLGLGSIKFRGINLGVAGVLFSGLTLGHFGFKINHEVLEFVREFGLILFVFTIGLQVGPGFFASFKKQGVAMNVLALSAVVLSAILVALIFRFASVPLPAASGMFSGATTNTPSLAASVEALKQVPNLDSESLKLPSLAYAVAYPFGIVGTILTMLIVRRLFRIDVQNERKALEDDRRRQTQQVSAIALEVENPNLFGVSVARIPGLIESKAVISRVYREGRAELAHPELTLRSGDAVLVVAPKESFSALQLAVGKPRTIDLNAMAGELTAKRVLVTSKSVLGKHVEELHLLTRFGVHLTRITRSDQDFTAVGGLALQFGDLATLVGREKSVNEAATSLGNSTKDLNHPQLIPIFIGIALGILLGSMPIVLPGMPAAVKLGLAGGPLIAAILLSRLGNFGPLVWYMPPNANYMVREMGIALFLACVGLHSGDSFIEILRHGDGVRWMLLAMIVTLVPILSAAIFGRAVLKLNYVSLCGMVAGSMTDPPALAFANLITESEGAAIAYATVYPLTMILRIFIAQLIVLTLM